MARAPVSKTGGWGFESLHSCQVGGNALIFLADFAAWKSATLRCDNSGISVHPSGGRIRHERGGEQVH
jgi:hypothetical protein